MPEKNDNMAHTASRRQRVAVLFLLAAGVLCFGLALAWIFGTAEELSEPYNHQGQLESIRRSGIFRSVVFGVLDVAFIWSATPVSNKPK